MTDLSHGLRLACAVGVCACCAALQAALPDEYQGRPFCDDTHRSGPQIIPGRVELAFYDMGGEGVAYHDTDATNNGSGVLNREPLHQRPGIPERIVHFREAEGVDISFTKDFADFNHPNDVDPPVNQLYIGWEADGEWTNYTVNVLAAGRYRIVTIYGNRDNGSSLSLDGGPPVNLVLPKDTGNWHYWTQATIGHVVITEPGLHLLTLNYNEGANLAFLDFILEEPFGTDPPTGE